MRPFRLLAFSLAAGFGLACAGAHTPEPGSEIGAAPTITRLSPSSGPAGEAYPIRVTVEGRGFAETGNVVVFGGIQVEGLPSSEEGSRLVFSVPKTIPSAGEVPPLVLQPGEYAVTVTTPRGTSEPVIFTLTPGD